MTTPERAKRYELQHLLEHEGRPVVVSNPNNWPVEALPIIYGFNNGGSSQWYSAIAIAQDGTCLGSHICSSEGYMPADLGILEGTRPDWHESQYRNHYPDGYRMEFVPFAVVREHEGLQAAFRANEEKRAKEEGE